MRTTLFWIATAIVFVVPNFLIWQKENLRHKSNTVYIELAPVDPRSLMQGDYMILNSKMSQTLRMMKKKPPRQGFLVIKVAPNKVARLLRVRTGNKPLRSGERLLKYRFRKGRYQVGADAFFFQEGHGKYYNNAKYGEYRLSSSGQTLLIGLRDGKLRKMAPPPEARKKAPKKRHTQGPTLRRPPIKRAKVQSAPPTKSSTPTQR